MNIENPPRKIYMNDKLWFDFKPDKIVFGGQFLNNKDQHLTLPFGLKSGFMDLHLTHKGLHYPVCILNILDLLKFAPVLMTKFTQSMYQNIKPFNISEIGSKEYSVKVLQGYNKSEDIKLEAIIKNGFNSLRSSPTSKKIKIRDEDEKLKNLENEIKEEQYVIDIELKDIDKLDSVFAFLQFEDHEFFLLKSDITGGQLCSFECFNLNISSVLEDVFGKELISLIESKIRLGQSIFNAENYREVLNKDESLPIRVVTK